MKIMDLDGFLDNHHLHKPCTDDFLSLMLMGAIRDSASAIYLKPNDHKIEYLVLIEGVRYDSVPIPGFRIYNELKSRAQNQSERNFIARYEGKNHLVEMLIGADDDTKEILELKIAA